MSYLKHECKTGKHHECDNNDYNNNCLCECHKNVFVTLTERIRKINIANGWKVVEPSDWLQEYKIPACLSLIHSEVSEALEAFRMDDKENFAEELADTVIRILDLVSGLPFINILEAIKAKLLVNEQRGYRHGNKKV